MAINFPDSPSNGDTTTLAGKTYTFDSSKSKWSPSGAVTLSALSVGAEATASGDGGIAYNNGSGVFTFTPAVAAGTGVTVYASQSAMLAADASSAVSEGSLHYDTGANKLYVKMGDASSTGFYLLASIINASPAISSPSTGTAFELDGTPNPTTISIAATDSDAGQTLNYYYTVSTGSIGSGTTVTTSATAGGTYASSGNAVAGSGNASTNSHFRLNPSNSVATSFSLTFYVTDGINVSNTICSFTLSFQIQNSRYTSLLMSANAAGTNSTFTDSSSSGHTITPSGNPAQGSFSPYRKGGYSVEFGGSSPKLSHGGSRSTISGSSDYSFSLWIYPQSGVDKWIYENATPFPSNVNSTGSQDMYLAGGSQITFRHHNGSSLQTITGPAVTLNTWTYILINRTSSTTTMYVNGSSAGSSSAMNGTINFPTNTPYIGSKSSGASFDGFITDFHFRTAAASSPTNVPTERVASDSSTLILSCHLPYPTDGSSNNFPVTLSGDASISPYGPYDYSEANADDGGSIFFDGGNSSDYLELNDGTTGSDFNLSNATWTLETWFYKKQATGSRPESIIARWDNATSTAKGWSWQVHNDNSRLIWSADGSANTIYTDTRTVPSNQWVHLAMVKNGSTLTSYISGVGSAIHSSDFTIYSTTTKTRIGCVFASGAVSETTRLRGNLSNLRVVKGTAVYTSDFTPSTTQLTAVTNTKLLVKGQGAKIFDKSQTANAQIYGNTAATTVTHNNFDPQSVYFDASSTSQHIAWRENISLAGEFTVEGWFNPSQFSKVPWCVGQYRIQLLLKESTSRVYRASGGWQDFSHSTLSSGNWYHIALCRNASNQIQMWFGGVRSSQILNDSQTFAGDFLVLGGEANAAGTTAGDAYQGYIQDFRVSNIARYSAADETGNIPTAPLKG